MISPVPSLTSNCPFFPGRATSLSDIDNNPLDVFVRNHDQTPNNQDMHHMHLRDGRNVVGVTVEHTDNHHEVMNAQIPNNTQPHEGVLHVHTNSESAEDSVCVVGEVKADGACCGSSFCTIQ